MRTRRSPKYASPRARTRSGNNATRPRGITATLPGELAEPPPRRSEQLILQRLFRARSARRERPDDDVLLRRRQRAFERGFLERRPDGTERNRRQVVLLAQVREHE